MPMAGKGPPIGDESRPSPAVSSDRESADPSELLECVKAMAYAWPCPWLWPADDGCSDGGGYG